MSEQQTIVPGPELCDGFVKVTIETGPEFKITPTVARALDQIQDGLETIAAEIAGDDDVSGFNFGGPLSSPMGFVEPRWSDMLGTSQVVGGKYGCHCVAVGKTVDNA